MKKGKEVKDQGKWVFEAGTGIVTCTISVHNFNQNPDWIHRIKVTNPWMARGIRPLCLAAEHVWQSSISCSAVCWPLGSDCELHDRLAVQITNQHELWSMFCIACEAMRMVFNDLMTYTLQVNMRQAALLCSIALHMDLHLTACHRNGNIFIEVNAFSLLQNFR
jgi:hypothetical protein